VILTDYQGFLKGAAIAAVASLGLMLAQPALARDAPQSFADLVDKLMPTVVNITTTQNVPQQGGPRMRDMPQLPPGSPFEELFKEFFDKRGGEEQKRRGTSLGSGFIVDGEGYIVTNAHVVDSCTTVGIEWIEGDEIVSWSASLIAIDYTHDLAILKPALVKPFDEEVPTFPAGLEMGTPPHPGDDLHWNHARIARKRRSKSSRRQRAKCVAKTSLHFKGTAPARGAKRCRRSACSL